MPIKSSTPTPLRLRWPGETGLREAQIIVHWHREPAVSQVDNRSKMVLAICLATSNAFFIWRDSGVSLKGQISRLPKATMMALRLDCSTAALTTPQKVLPIWRLVELKMLDFRDHTRTGISILTSVADSLAMLTRSLGWPKWKTKKIWTNDDNPNNTYVIDYKVVMNRWPFLALLHFCF